MASLTESASLPGANFGFLLLCPITHEIFVEPVKALDGHTYERSALEHALHINGLSPITRQPLKIEECVIDFTMLAMIDEHNKNNQSEQKINPIVTVTEQVTGTIQKNGTSALVTLNTADGENGGKSVVFVVDISGKQSFWGTPILLGGHGKQ